MDFLIGTVFCGVFKSAPMYVQRIEDFMRWKFNFGEVFSLEAYLIRYFDYKNSELNEVRDRRYSATTLRSWFSIILLSESTLTKRI